MNQFFRQLTRWSAAIALLTLAVGCSTPKPLSDTSQSTGAVAQSSSDTLSQQAKSKLAVETLPKPHDVGEAIAIADKNLNLQLTVHDTREHQGKGLIKPNRGKKWIVVDTTIANQGQEPKMFSVVSFELLDSNSNQYEVALLAGALDDVESPTGEIKPGDEQRGQVAFEVPENAKGLKLLFKPNFSDCEATDSQQKGSETLNCEPVVVKLD